MTLQTLNNIRELAQQLRVGSVRYTTAAGNDPHRIHKNRSSGQEQHTRSEERWRK